MVIDQAVMDTLVMGIIWVALILGALIVAEIAAKVCKWGDYDN